MDALIHRAEVLKEDWAKLQGEHTPLGTLTEQEPRPAKRFPGWKHREAFYYVPILKALEEMGGKGRVADVLKRVWDQVHTELTEFDLAPLRSRGEIRWRNTACWARFKLIQQGLLRQGSPTGIWEITPQGQEYLARHLA